MRKNMTEIVFILDRSGSMSGLETDTIGGFNSMIEKQKKENGEALISTVLFDNVSEVIHDRVPVQKVEPMTDRDYSVRGCTALLDAIGGAIHHIGNVHKYARNEDVPEHTLFVITTDGMENASRRYDSETVKKMIERQKEKLDEEYALLEEQNNAKIEKIDEFLDNEGAVRDQAMADIMTRSETVYQELMEWNAKYGDGINKTVTDAWKAATCLLYTSPSPRD